MMENISGPIQIHSTTMLIHSTVIEIHSTANEKDSTAMLNRSAANEIRSTLNEIHSKMAQKRAFSVGAEITWLELVTSSPTGLLTRSPVLDSLRRPLLGYCRGRGHESWTPYVVPYWISAWTRYLVSYGLGFSANFAAAICGRRRPVAGIPDIISRIAARNPPPAGAISDNRAQPLRSKATSRFRLSVRRAPDSPGCKNRLRQRPRVFVLPPAKRGRKLAAGICAGTAAVPDESAKRTSRFFGPCRVACQARSNECDRASDNTPGNKALPARRREASVPEI